MSGLRDHGPGLRRARPIITLGTDCAAERREIRAEADGVEAEGVEVGCEVTHDDGPASWEVGGAVGRFELGFGDQDEGEGIEEGFHAGTMRGGGATTAK